jgi:uncharacterized protein
MRIVLDTNVIIAAFISRGSCSELLEHCVLNHDLVLSDFILEETSAKLKEKFHFTAIEAEAVTKLLHSRCTLVPVWGLSVQICDDPDDDNIIGTALSGSCQMIVSGDKKLLKIGSYQSVRIVSPREFWSLDESV